MKDEITLVKNNDGSIGKFTKTEIGSRPSKSNNPQVGVIVTGRAGVGKTAVAIKLRDFLLGLGFTVSLVDDPEDTNYDESRVDKVIETIVKAGTAITIMTKRTKST